MYAIRSYYEPREIAIEGESLSRTANAALEDLSAGVCPSWGITTAQAEAALDRLPAFHAKWWNQSAAKRFDWAIQLEEESFWNPFKLDLEKNFGIAEERLGSEMPAEYSAIVEATLTKYQAFLDHLETRPRNNFV